MKLPAHQIIFLSGCQFTYFSATDAFLGFPIRYLFAPPLVGVVGGLLVLQFAEASDRKFATADESQHEYKAVVVPFFAKHCNGCHNAKKTEGDLDLASLKSRYEGNSQWSTLGDLGRETRNARNAPAINHNPTPQRSTPQ